MKKARKEIKSLIAIGNPIVDISAEIDKEAIEKYSLAWGSTVFANEKNMGIFEVLEKNPNVIYVPGGSAENSLRVCSWCHQMTKTPKNKRTITMLGCTGDDEYRNKIIESLQKSGVTPLLEINKSEETSRCGVGINEKERCLISLIKASNKISQEFIDNNMKKILSHDALYVEGYFILEKFDICKNLVKAFKEKNKKVIFSLSAIFVINSLYDKVIEIANDSDLVFCNIEECEALAGKKTENQIDALKLAHEKLTPGDRLFVVTAGSRGVMCSKYDYEQKDLEFVLQEFPKFIKKSDIVDTNGAGDAFLGGFMSQWMKCKDLNVCCKFGNAASGVILRNVGCTFDTKQVIKI